MGQSQCSACFTPLETRDVTPCFVCGGWPDSVRAFDGAAVFTDFRLPAGHTLTLCPACELEEFLVPGGWGYQLTPGTGMPADSLRWVRTVERPQLGRDKFCPTCNLRLAFLNVLVAHPPRPDADTRS